MKKSVSNDGEAINLSIITVHLNDFTGFERTLKSVNKVLHDTQCEWIVIDGGSDITNDANNTFSLAKSLATHFVSAPDNGIYDAMNKGTQLARGEYVMYLNAGDELHPAFSYQKLTDSLYTGNASMIWGKADVRDRHANIYARKIRKPRWLRYGMAASHQAILFRRSEIGHSPYDTHFDIAADYELVCRLYTAGTVIKIVDFPVCIFDLVGKSGENKRLTLDEESRVRRKYFKVPGFISRVILEFKYLVWQLGTLFPAFRRTWSRFF